jgi:hypothetical protein
MSAGTPPQDGPEPRGPSAGARQGGGLPNPRISQGGGLPDRGASGPSSGEGSSLQRLATLLREQGGLMAGLLPEVPVSTNGGGPAQLAAAGPRARDSAAEYELLIEAIYEGYLLHYGSPRLLSPAEADLGLLAGDRLYALGLARLVELGDVVAVGELADVITLTALAHGDGAGELAEAIWEAGARAVGWGPSEQHARAKALARAGSPEALGAMRALLILAP